MPIVNAEEVCTQEKINSYIQYIDKYKINYKTVQEDSFYEVWVSNVVGGIALDHNGIIIFDNGFLGYGYANESFNVKVYIADGGVCAGETVKNIQLSMPKKETPTKPDPILNLTPPQKSPDNPTSKPTTDGNKSSEKNQTKEPEQQVEIPAPNINQNDGIEIPTVDNTDSKEIIIDTEENKDNEKVDTLLKGETQKDDNKFKVITSLSFFLVAIILVIRKIIFKK